MLTRTIVEKILFLTPYFLSLFISVWISLYAWRHRQVQGAGVYAVYVASQSLWIFGYILELLSPTIEGKIFWDAFQWIAGFAITITFPVFAIRYSGIKLAREKLLFRLSLIAPSLFLIALFTDSFHHLYYPSPYLDNTYLIAELAYDFTWLVYVYALYGYIVTLTGVGILLRRLFRPHRLYRRQILTIILGFLFPIVFSVMTVIGVEFVPFRDISPFTFAVGNLIVAWGLFRFKLFEVVPIARDIVLENIEDLVIVLDNQDRIVDINQKALKALSMSSAQVIGQPVQKVYQGVPHILERFQKPENLHTHISIQNKKKLYHYNISSTLLTDRGDRVIGRVFVANDITEHIEMQEKLKALNDELEERVEQRTKELSESMERYRTVVEHQTEFIVRWKPDRTRTFVNEAYCRYFGFTFEEAIQVDFMTLIHEDDRQAVLEKIARIESGETNAERDIHRSIKPDGSFGWNEWIDIAIYNEAGEIVEFQSVGRDITARKEAEDALTLSEEKFQKAYNTTSALMTIEDDKGVFIDINQAFLDAFGFKREEVIGHKASELNFVYNPDELITLQKVSQEQGRLKDFETRIRRKSGEISTVSLSSDDFYMNGVKHIVTSGLDITERKQAEESLRKSEEDFRLLAENSSDMISRHDPDGVYLYVSPACHALLGFEPEELIGLSEFDFIHPDDQAKIEQSRQKVSREQVVDIVRYRFSRKDSSYIWLESTSRAIRDQDSGEIVEIQVSSRDITERRRAELARQESEERFRDLFENMNDGFALHKIILDESGKPVDYQFIDVNPIFLERIGMEAENIINRTALELFPGTEQEWIDVFGEVAMTGRPVIYTNYSSELDKYYETRLYCPRPGYFAGVFTDVTKQKKAEEDLHKAYESTLWGWAKALEYRDKETEGHSRRVVKIMEALSLALGISEKDELTKIRRGAILHDIGKLAIPDSILLKPGKLTAKEWDLMSQHPKLGYDMISEIDYLKDSLEIVLSHHEKWDGSGYPDGLKGTEIPLAARIFAVIDVWDAVQSERPYKHAWSQKEAINLIKEEAGSHFDPQIVEVFLDLIEKGEVDPI